MDSDFKLWCETRESVRWKQIESLIFRALNHWQDYLVETGPITVQDPS